MHLRYMISINFESKKKLERVSYQHVKIKIIYIHFVLKKKKYINKEHK